jgi:putative membrane protein
MKPTKTRYIVFAAITCFIFESRLPAQQSSTNNNDLSYTTLGRRATTINNDNGSQPHLGTPLSSRRNTTGEPTNAGGGIDAGPFGASGVIDSDFVWAAGIGALVEIELGKIAAEKAQSDTVKKFADNLVKGHQRMRTALEAIATEHALNFPKELDPKRKARIEEVSKLSGADFDRAYLRHVLSYYERSLGRFDFEATNGTIPELAAWTQRVLPRIRHQLKLAKEEARAVQTAAPSVQSKAGPAPR